MLASWRWDASLPLLLPRTQAHPDTMDQDVKRLGVSGRERGQGWKVLVVADVGVLCHRAGWSVRGQTTVSMSSLETCSLMSTGRKLLSRQ